MKTYSAPEINVIQMDNEISLILCSKHDHDNNGNHYGHGGNDYDVIEYYDNDNPFDYFVKRVLNSIINLFRSKKYGRNYSDINIVCSGNIPCGKYL